MNVPDDAKIAEESEKWLNAHYDPISSIYTFTQCMALSDINADGDHKLIIADLGTGTYNMKLKVYKGTVVMTENAIIDLPTGVVTFYMDINEPRTPAIAVASGPYIYVYKNLRPYFKFTLPTLDIHPMEQDLWNQLKNEKIGVSSLVQRLDDLRHTGAVLTVRSLRFMQLPVHDLEAFASLHKHSPLKRQTVVTCLGTLRKTMADEDGISCLVLGTESCQIYVLDPEAFTILCTVSLPAVPVFMSVTGLYDVEFRMIIACRNGGVYTVKRGTDSAKECFMLSSQIVGLERINKSIIVGTMNEMLHCYTSKGKKMWTVRLPGSVTTMELLEHTQWGLKAVMVALTNNTVHIYREKFLINVFRTEDVITGMRFGRFGREENALVMTTKAGGLCIKMLKRTAVFDDKALSVGPPPSQSQRLNVPKKSKLFVDQTMRERSNSVVMHRQFQHDLYRLRLDTARNYVKALEKSMNPISTSAEEPLKLAAQVQGIGPTFKLTINLQNTSMNVPSMGLMVTFDYDHKLYSMKKSIIHAPMLVPGLNYAFEVFVECLSDKGISDILKVFVMRKGNCVPIITAVINMPVSEGATVV